MNHEVELVTLAPDLAHCPDSTLPELAFSGRSNVGKSSLLNLLVGRRRVAHTSGQPGKTRNLSYYLVDGRWHLVDMPGYGYARRSRAERHRWAAASKSYLLQRHQLQAVLQLVDLRVGVTPDDRARLRELLSAGHNFCIVFTKVDKIAPQKRDRLAGEHLAGLGLPATTGVILSSAKEGLGLEQLWAWMEDHLGLGAPSSSGD
jgi:GTP-binding protein